MNHLSYPSVDPILSICLAPCSLLSVHISFSALIFSLHVNVRPPHPHDLNTYCISISTFSIWCICLIIHSSVCAYIHAPSLLTNRMMLWYSNRYWMTCFRMQYNGKNAVGVISHVKSDVFHTPIFAFVCNQGVEKTLFTCMHMQMRIISSVSSNPRLHTPRMSMCVCFVLMTE